VAREFEFTERFQREYKRLDPQTQAAADEALKALDQDPLPRALRHHTLNGYRPKVHVIDVTSNHSHQITFHWDGNLLRLLRIGTHRQIDNAPR
jgi:mRNA-degrading endonuclease YafQ of YafQ-DinJ toxin-antitoxin module